MTHSMGHPNSSLVGPEADKRTERRPERAPTAVKLAPGPAICVSRPTRTHVPIWRAGSDFSMRAFCAGRRSRTVRWQFSTAARPRNASARELRILDHQRRDPVLVLLGNDSSRRRCELIDLINELLGLRAWRGSRRCRRITCGLVRTRIEDGCRPDSSTGENGRGCGCHQHPAHSIPDLHGFLLGSWGSFGDLGLRLVTAPRPILG
jgi:hypothetical protein